jgi:outer membrane lipoprotein carrier protein
MKSILVFALRSMLALLLFWPPAGLTGAVEARQALERFLDGLETFSAEFTQTLTDETGFVLQEANGRFSLALPDRLRWELQAPFEQTIVADGLDLWLFDPELRQATVRPLAQSLESTPLALLTQPHRLDERFDVLDEPGREGLFLILTPRSIDADFTRVELEFAQAGDLRSLAFLDIFGQRTEIRLQAFQRNPELPPGEYRLDLPPGTDIYRP